MIIENLTKSYGKKEVLKNLSLTAEEGLIHGIIGSNGAGKTSLFQCITNMEDYSGKIRLTGNPRIGYLPASLFYYSNMKGMEYIEFCLIARKQPVDKIRIEEMNRLFELPLQQYATEYSTGMKKKLALMTLALEQNDLYILDEPFNGLDLSATLLLKQLVIKWRETGKTILISSHIISSLTDICDKIHYLKGGEIRKTYTDFNCIESDILQYDSSDMLEKLDRIRW